jgi:hypothetical protein
MIFRYSATNSTCVFIYFYSNKRPVYAGQVPFFFK